MLLTCVVIKTIIVETIKILIVIIMIIILIIIISNSNFKTWKWCKVGDREMQYGIRKQNLKKLEC